MTAPALRVGVDVVQPGDLDRMLDEPRFCRRTFAALELALIDGAVATRRREFLTGRFAAKEALLKVLGRGLLHGVALRDIVIDRSARGGPVVRLVGSAAAAATAEGLDQFSVSIAHKPAVVVAVALGYPAATAAAPGRPAAEPLTGLLTTLIAP